MIPVPLVPDVLVDHEMPLTVLVALATFAVLYLTSEGLHALHAALVGWRDDPADTPIARRFAAALERHVHMTGSMTSIPPTTHQEDPMPPKPVPNIDFPLDDSVIVDDGPRDTGLGDVTAEIELRPEEPIDVVVNVRQARQPDGSRAIRVFLPSNGRITYGQADQLRIDLTVAHDVVADVRRAAGYES